MTRKRASGTTPGQMKKEKARDGLMKHRVVSKSRTASALAHILILSFILLLFLHPRLVHEDYDGGGLGVPWTLIARNPIEQTEHPLRWQPARRRKGKIMPAMGLRVGLAEKRSQMEQVYAHPFVSPASHPGGIPRRGPGAANTEEGIDQRNHRFPVVYFPLSVRQWVTGYYLVRRKFTLGRRGRPCEQRNHLIRAGVERTC